LKIFKEAFLYLRISLKDQFMNYLIVDLNITLNGHKLGFVQETMNFLALHHADSEHEFHFLVNEPLKKSDSNKFQVHYPGKSYQAKFDKYSGLKKYKEQWQYIAVKAGQLDIHKVVLMEFDLYQAAIGFDKDTAFDISGIWFRPYFRQKAIGLTLFEKVKFNIRRVQKKGLLKSSLRNSRLKKIFILNDQKTVDFMNEREGDRFAYLADPVFDYPCYKLTNIRDKYLIKDDRLIFLIFGYMDERKNVVNVLKAIEKLSKTEQEKICLMLIGKTAEHYEATLLEAIEKHNSEIQLFHIDEFVDNCEMEALFSQCDLVLRMNINFFASSGIIGLAAKYDKPSLVSDYGIVAELTEKYEMGRLVDPLKVDQIKELFSSFVKEPDSWKIDGSAYYRDHNTRAFVENLLQLN
ncbi:glycosyltransferase, partial [Jiulongibacter sediminis]|uniref:glycosyltransferase n=1 Tax=Jiulongibacter sediminis TaxID=1605367 RepID=UPI001C0F6DD8